MHQTIFSGTDIEVEADMTGAPVTIVTFEARNKYISATRPSPFGPGFARGIMTGLGYNEILVKRSRNHWYQTPEMTGACAAIRARSAGTRVVTYGSSMGAFAAIAFATRLNAQSFVALSPLYDIAPDSVVADDRWPESADLEFCQNLIRDGACTEAEGYLFFCRGSADEDHARQLQRMTRARVIECAYGGHPCSFYLNDAYGLKRLVHEIAGGDFAEEPFLRDLAQGTAATHYPYEAAAIRAADAGNLPEAITQIRQAIAAAPGQAVLHRRLGNYLHDLNDLSGAEAAYRAGLRANPNSSQTQIRLSYLLVEQGNPAAAAAEIADLLTREGHKPELHMRLAEWLLLAGDPAGAESAILRAIALKPRAVGARQRLGQIRLALGALRRAWLRTPDGSALHRASALWREIRLGAGAEPPSMGSKN